MKQKETVGMREWDYMGIFLGVGVSIGMALGAIIGRIAEGYSEITLINKGILIGMAVGALIGISIGILKINYMKKEK